MKELPNAVVSYKKTPTFNNETVPKGLLRSHTTKSGTWGKITVLNGKLLYRILEPQIEEIVLTPGVFGVVEPTIKHEVQLFEETEFFVDFHH